MSHIACYTSPVLQTVDCYVPYVAVAELPNRMVRFTLRGRDNKDGVPQSMDLPMEDFLTMVGQCNDWIVSRLS